MLLAFCQVLYATGKRTARQGSEDDVFVFPHLLVFFIELRIPDFIHAYDFAQSESYRRYNQLE